MKRMLFNATQQEELRVAIVNGQKLIDIDIEAAGRELHKSNIYKGIITRIEPSLEACFVNYGEERHGFLPFKEVARGYFKEGVDVRNASIKDALREGQEVIVQVEKEERGNKGAALTSFISLAGRYLVLMPNNPRGGGVSRRVEGEDRQELRETMDQLDLPSGMSVIARTAGIGRNVDELQWDLNYLMQLWRAIDGAGKSAQGAFLIYQESSLVIRAIRDYFQPDIGEILIDTDDIFEQAQQFMSHVMPDMVHRVKRYSDDVPLFSRFQIEHQIETAYSRTVPLPSGGAIVIDHTEALVSVDVNSARATRGSDIETTAFNTNCEAAEEVARQLRLRDLGGLIVIDFIDMENTKNQREVETRLKDALRYDRARVQMGKISRFGLMELSRQRLRPSLSEGSHVTCPRCNGTGHIRDTESSALQVLRIIQEEAMKENSAAIHVQVPVDVAAFLLNEKRGEILKIETRHRVTAILIPNKHLETPHYKLDRLKHDDPRLEDAHASYTMAEQADTDIGYSKRQKDDVKPRQEAVVKSITPETAPIVERKPALVTEEKSDGLFSGIAKFFGSLFGGSSEKTPAIEDKPKHGRDKNGDRNRQRTRGRNGRNSRHNNIQETTREERPTNTNGNRPEKEVAKPAASEPSVPAQGQTRQGKQARPPREERESQDPRRERHARQREARKEKDNANAEIKTDDQANLIPVLASPSADNAQNPLPPKELSQGNDSDANAPQTEEGRRRRRGGRNRNRRDRQATDGNEVQAVNNAASSDTPQEIAPVFIPIEDLLTHAKPVEPTPIQTSFDLTPSPIAESLNTLIAETPAQNTPIETVPNTTIAVESFVSIAETNTNVLEVAPTVVTAMTKTNDAESVENAQSPTFNTAPTATSIDYHRDTRVTEQSPQAVAVVVPTPEALTTPTPSVDLATVLENVGLVLASTDPEKLKAAQASTAQINFAPRVVRERKPAPPPPSEPLSMIETKR